MSGKKGRSGRRRLSAAEHLLKGTFRRDRHGELPTGVQPVRPFASVPRSTPASPSEPQPLKFLTIDDCPAVLTDEGRAFWLTVITTRPVEKIFGQLVATYVQAWVDWQRATRAIQQTGDLIRVGNRPVVNPHHALRREAAQRMLDAAKFLNWQPTVAKADQTATTATPGKLAQFLDAKRRRIRR
jgi:terminase small subunit-like protein